ncbi:MAG TPA: tripartite tricarboxylate transporter substrate-binding protein, partial [Burkholderiales bacterium]|nr:tripartite tricarboxylate transporter substrate-binding protein [Burkholderiales bacterium]
QSYPAKPVRVVVPWPPAGVTDVLTRALVQAMSESMGQQFVVENRPGAGGTLGLAPVAKSAPDGYTIVASDVPSHAISATLYAKLPYDVLNDFEPIAMIAGSPMVLTTNPALGVRTLKDFILLARSRSAPMSYGSSGNGSITHLAIERLKRDAAIDLVHVPYKGTVPAIASVLSGDTALAFGTIPGVVPHAKAGKLVLLGSSFGKRFSQIPEVPAVAETIPGYDMGFYTALLAPAKTPKEIVDKLYQEVVKAHAQPKVKEIFANSAAEPGTMTPAQLKQYLAAEVKAWGDVVRSVGLKID